MYLPAFIALLTVDRVTSKSYQWTGLGGDTQWLTPENWMPIGVPKAADDSATIYIPNKRLLVEHEMADTLTLAYLNCTNATVRIARINTGTPFAGVLSLQTLKATDSEVQITNICCGTFEVEVNNLDANNSLMHITGGTAFHSAGTQPVVQVYGGSILLFNQSGSVSLSANGDIGANSAVLCLDMIPGARLTWNASSLEGDLGLSNCTLGDSNFITSGTITLVNATVINTGIISVGEVRFNASQGNVTLSGNTQIQAGIVRITATAEHPVIAIDCGTAECKSNINTVDLLLDGVFNPQPKLYFAEIYPCINITHLGLSPGLSSTLDAGGMSWPTIHLVKQAKVGKIAAVTPLTLGDRRLYSVVFASGAGSQFACQAQGGSINITNEVGNLRVELHEDARLENVSLAFGEIRVSNTSTGLAPTVTFVSGSIYGLSVEMGNIKFGPKFTITHELRIYHPMTMPSSTLNDVRFGCVSGVCDVALNGGFINVTATPTEVRTTDTIISYLQFDLTFNNGNSILIDLENKNLTATIFFSSPQSLKFIPNPRTEFAATISLYVATGMNATVDMSLLKLDPAHFGKSNISLTIDNGTTVYGPEWPMSKFRFVGSVNLICNEMYELPDIEYIYSGKPGQLFVTSHVLKLGMFTMQPPFWSDMVHVYFIPLDPAKVNMITYGQRQYGIEDTALVLTGKGVNSTQFTTGPGPLSGVVFTNALVVIPENVTLVMPGLDLLGVTLDQRTTTRVTFGRNSRLYLFNVTLAQQILCMTNDVAALSEGYCWEEGSQIPACNTQSLPPLPTATQTIEVNFVKKSNPGAPYTEKEESSKTAGIVLGSLAGVAVLAGILFLAFRNHRRLKYSSVDDEKL